MFGFSPTCVDAFGEYPQAYGLGDYPTTGEIAAAVLAALNATTIPVDTKKMNGHTIIGGSSEADPWRGVGVQP